MEHLDLQKQLMDENSGFGGWNYCDLVNTANGEFLVPGFFKERTFSKMMIFKSGFTGLGAPGWLSH